MIFRQPSPIRLGIDASNIRAGGGLTHLVELLRAVDLAEHGVSEVTVWAGRQTLGRVPQKPGLRLEAAAALDGGLPSRLLWQKNKLTSLALARCDLLLVPGGTYTGRFRPVVTMFRNLLPFDPPERRRYGFSAIHLRLLLLGIAQARTFQRADGVIFLTKYSQAAVERRTGALRGLTAVIPHGKAEAFNRAPRRARPLTECSPAQPFRWLYVSIVDVYKHQWQVVEVVGRLRRAGLPVALDLIGPAYPPALARLLATIQRVDPAGEFIRYLGPVAYEELHAHYQRADAFVFASSCETFGQILVEAMASGLPIACANRSAMPELLGDAGAYFDPEQPAEIAMALKQLMDSVELRDRYAQAAYQRAQAFTWTRCARETFSFLNRCGRREAARSNP